MFTISSISAREDGDIGAVSLIIFEGKDTFHLSVFPTGETLESKHKRFSLDGNFSANRARRTWKELGWRRGRGNITCVILRSEDVFLKIEDFPTKDDGEILAMAQAWMQGMIEFDPTEHSLSVAILSQTSSKTSCVLAVFHRERIEKVFEVIQALGIDRPCVVFDIFMQGIGDHGDLLDGDWGWISRIDSKRVLVKGLRIRSGKRQAVYQRFLSYEPNDTVGLDRLAGELFSESPSPLVAWEHSLKDPEIVLRLMRRIRIAGLKEVPSFELQPVFWRERWKQWRTRRRWMWGLKLAATGYLAWVLILCGLFFQHRREGLELRETFQNQEIPFKKTMEVKRELIRTHASVSPSSNALEVLRQTGESMPETLTLETFSYHSQDGVKLRGIGSRGEAVYDFVTKLRKIPIFRAASVESMEDNPKIGGVNWQIVSAFHGSTLPSL